MYSQNKCIQIEFLPHPQPCSHIETIAMICVWTGGFAFALSRSARPWGQRLPEPERLVSPTNLQEKVVQKETHSSLELWQYFHGL